MTQERRCWNAFKIAHAEAMDVTSLARCRVALRAYRSWLDSASMPLDVSRVLVGGYQMTLGKMMLEEAA